MKMKATKGFKNTGGKFARKVAPGQIKMRRPSSMTKPKTGLAAQRDIRELQTGKMATSLLIRMLPYQRVAREIANEYYNKQEDPRMQKPALLDLQYSTETFMVELFELANEICHHSGRKTITKKDLQLAFKAKGYKF